LSAPRVSLTGLLQLWPWLAAAASGVLATACFPPFNQDWLAWIALTPLIIATWFSGKNARRPWLRNALLGYVGGLVFFTASFSWLGSLGRLFESLALFGLPFLLSLYLAMHWAFWGWFSGLIAPRTFTTSWRNLLSGCLGASAWVTHDWLRGWLFGGFGWNGIGVSQYSHWLLIQIAEFTGIAGISFVIVLANIMAVTVSLRLFYETRTHQMRPHWDLNLSVLAIFGLLAFGWNRMHAVAQTTASVRVAAVQPNIGQKEKFDPSSSSRVFDQLTRLSQPAVQSTLPPQLMIWPESATPGPMLADEQTYHFVMDFAAAAHVDLLLGSDVFDQGQAYNAAFLVPARGDELQVYRKIHLVPFGEYVPLRHSFPLFAAVAGRWVPGDFGFGKEYTRFSLTTADVRVAPLICFEDTIGELTRQFVLPRDSQRGADVLVNITNDGWFLHSAGSHQHLANALFRCVEVRRPMVRAANTGVTCFINEFGRISQILQDDKGNTFGEGVLVDDIKLPTGGALTFYARHGEMFAEICAGITLLGVVVLIAVSRRAPVKITGPEARRQS
jgi:apolipoprotein N-acyltransferase